MPRTDTSDQPPASNLLIVPLVRGIFSAPQGSIYNNGYTGLTVVVVTIDAVSQGVNDGATIQIGVNVSSTGAGVGVFGAATGAGAFDTFSWRGYLPLLTSDSLRIVSLTGQWAVSASGYFIPTQFPN